MNKIVILLIMIACLIGCANKQMVVNPPINEAELGKQAFDKEDYKGAVEYYDQWLMKYPNDAGVLLERGRANRQIQKFGEALEDFEKAAAANPKDLTPKVYVAHVLIALERIKEGKAALEMVMASPLFQKVGPYEKFLSFYMDGQLKNLEENCDKALLSLDEATKIFELYPHIFRNYKSPAVDRFVVYQRAVAFFGMNDYPKAAAEMARYIEISKQKGTEVTSRDYKSLAIALYLSENISKCKAILPNVSPEDRKELAITLGDSIFEQQ